MDFSALSGAPAANTTANTTTTDSRTSLADNYDTFLVLLTAQLQNQDPLAPMDSTQFTQQLVQFSQVEQQIRTNEQLEGLVGQYKASLAGSALAYLGQDAVIESDKTVLYDGEANWAYELDGDAKEVTLTIKDAKGKVVFEREGDATDGEHLLSWNGKDKNGNILPEGVYSLTITATDAAGEPVKSSSTVREIIRGVDFSGGTPLVLTPSGTHELSAVRAIIDRVDPPAEEDESPI